MPVCKTPVDCVVILNTAGDAGRHDHGTGLPADFPLGNDLLVKVVHHHSGFLGDGIAVAFNKAAQLFLCPLLVEHRVVLDGLHQSIKAVDWRIALQHIQNKAFLDGLFHRIHMERSVFDVVSILERNAEGLQRFVLRSGCERKVAGVVQQLAPLHHGIDLVLIIHLVIRSEPGECKVHLRRISAALTGVRLVNNNGKAVILVFCPDLRDNVREFLNRSNDDTLSIGNCLC